MIQVPYRFILFDTHNSTTMAARQHPSCSRTRYFYSGTLPLVCFVVLNIALITGSTHLVKGAKSSSPSSTPTTRSNAIHVSYAEDSPFYNRPFTHNYHPFEATTGKVPSSLRLHKWSSLPGDGTKLNPKILVRGGGGRNRKQPKVIILGKATDTQRTHQVPLLSNQGVEFVRSTALKSKHMAFLALLLLRFAFLLLLPLSIALTMVAYAAAVIVAVLRVITFNTWGKEISKILRLSTKAFLAIAFASVSGILLPLFAIFGLIASVTTIGCEIMEPILRIRYNRQLKRLQHLHKLLSDPVLLDSMDILLKFAKGMSTAATDQVQRKSKFAAGQSKKAYDQLRGKSAQLVETLLQSSGVDHFIEHKLKERNNKMMMSPFMVKWIKDQWRTLRKSGVLEDAAARALQALEKELTSAASFLPYLEAIETVRTQELKTRGEKMRAFKTHTDRRVQIIRDRL